MTVISSGCDELHSDCEDLYPSLPTFVVSGTFQGDNLFFANGSGTLTSLRGVFPHTSQYTPVQKDPHLED
jgi:hypothetical protein